MSISNASKNTNTDWDARNELLGKPKASTEQNWRSLFPDIIGKSESLNQVLKDLLKISPSDCSVMILGESGTGKELAAAAIHRLSLRSHQCFIALNCSAIPEELLEAELFGHEKGAFTGADRKRIGHFGTAHQGTLFLDEIGDMTPRLQAKLLRVLQERKYSPLGSSKVLDADIRFIAATNKDLDEAVKNSTFRLDLYYRLNVLPVNLPPLRERPEDILMLAEHFLTLLNNQHEHSRFCSLNADVIHVLMGYAWPGNIRQLQNLIERLFIIKGGGEITLEDLPPEILEKDSELLPDVNTLPELKANFSLTRYIENIENNLILRALELTQKNKNQAAKLLGMNRTTLVEKIKKRCL